jgi:hypothetical protein
MFVMILATAVGCGSAPVTPVTPTPAEPKAPVRIGVLVDKTLSTTWTGVPAVAAEDFEPLLRLLLERGGELAVGLIRDRSNRGLRRLPMSLPPTPPAEPNPHQNPFLFAEAQAKYESEHREYEAALAAWRSEAEGRVAAFRKDLSELLAAAADAKRTDLWDAIRRAELFLNEPGTAAQPAAHKWLLVLSDGEDNMRRPKAALRSGARLLVVNSFARLGDLADLGAVPFESFQAAAAYLAAEESK